MAEHAPRRLALTVAPEQAGKTVDTLLRRGLGLSGTLIRHVKWLEDGILLDIVYEDADLLVLNKAPGVPCHPGPGHFDDTLGNFLLYYYDQSGECADYHPVHRLDRGTSGLMVVAKHPHAQERLKRALHTSAFRRGYLAVCQGVPVPAEGVVDAPIGPVPGSLMARRIDPAGRAPVPATRSCALPMAAPWCAWSWTPGAPTRSGSTWLPWAVL